MNRHERIYFNHAEPILNLELDRMFTKNHTCVEVAPGIEGVWLNNLAKIGRDLRKFWIIRDKMTKKLGVGVVDMVPMDSNGCPPRNWRPSYSRTILSADFDKIDIIYSENHWSDDQVHYIRVENEGKHGLYDSRGKVLFPLQYDDLQFISPCFISIVKNGGHRLLKLPSFMDIYHAVFQSIRPSKDQFICCVNGQYGVIDTMGKILIPFIYDVIMDAETGYICSKNGLKGYVRRDGIPTVPIIYRDVKTVFPSSLAVLDSDDDTMWRLITVDGLRKGILPEFDRMIDDADIARVIKDGRYGLITYEGDILMENTDYMEVTREFWRRRNTDK